MQAASLNNGSNFSKGIVSLDDKYVGVIIGEANDKIVIVSEECEAHILFEIVKCKIITSTDNRAILDLDMMKFSSKQTQKRTAINYP